MHPVLSANRPTKFECGRFAPSPSGPLRFGSLIAAVGSLLEARSQGGRWQVRIDDLDTPRTVPGAADDILLTLECYGMAWDEPVIYQSQCLDAYREALAQLIQQDLIYPCTCSRREINKIALPGASGMIYPGTCRNGVRQPKRPNSMRLKTHDQAIHFQDMIQGLCTQRLESQVGDFVIRRADDLFTYQLAVVVDDGTQGITQIVRGSDLLESTPRQIYLQRLLGLATPCYAHLPVAVDSYGRKLSKQTQAPSLDRRHPGHAIVAALTFLNQAPPGELAHESLDNIWTWALANWRRDRIPNRCAIPWPEATPPPITNPSGLTLNLGEGTMKRLTHN